MRTGVDSYQINSNQHDFTLSKDATLSFILRRLRQIRISGRPGAG